jgi:PhzF family phenazine biosynthesis protein
MRTRVLHFDVFTSECGKGNPAGIVLLPHHLDTHAMQAVAAATGFGDTAFLVPPRAADFGIRYFSPRREIDLCGHATIAAATAIHATGLLGNGAGEAMFSLETRAGILPIAIQPGLNGDPLVVMSQASSRFRPFGGDRQLLCRALHTSEEDLHPTLPIVYGSTGRWTLIVPLRSLDAVRRLKPQTENFPAALCDLPEASIHPFSTEVVGVGAHLHARHFSAPSSGTIEDPVTGTASGVLGAYYQEFMGGRDGTPQPLVVEQGYEVGREGRVLVWAEKGSGGYAVRIGGSAVLAEELLC